MSQDAQKPQEVDLYSPIDPDALPDDPALLKGILVQLLSMLRSETKRREEVERNLDLLLRKLSSPKSVAPSAGQKTLFDLSTLLGEFTKPPIPEAQPEAKPKQRHAHGRRRPPANMEQVDVVHDLPDDLKQQLGPANLIPLPDVETFQYDYQAAKLRVIRHLQKKYLRRDVASEQPLAVDPATEQAVEIDERSVSDISEAAPISDPARTEPAPTSREGDTSESQSPVAEPKILLAPKLLAMPSCEAAPGLLAFIWLSKYGDHLPLYRLETITQRYGISFSRSTTCGWMMELAEVLQRLWRRMADEVLLSRVIHTDDTTVQLQDPATRKHSTARFWNYIGDEQHALTVFEFTRTHERIGPATFLADYQGYLQADAYNGYDGLYLESSGKIIEVGCWQHARKRYKEAAKSDLRATVGLAFIKSMYKVEENIRKLRHAEWNSLTLDEQAARIVEIRQRESVPLLKAFREWIDKTIGDTLPKSELGEAFRYTLNQWDALNQFPTCGLLEIDNNAAERAHRGIAIGRKNWQMVGSERGGRAAAIHFSIIASCKMNAVEPFAYLVDVLERLPKTPAAELGELMPNRWRPQAAR